MRYASKHHAAVRTTDFVFNQLIPYIGNKRKLLGLILDALSVTERSPDAVFLDIFAGSGVVARMAKVLGYRVIANDWEPYARAINSCYIRHNAPPAFAALGGYEAAIRFLNGLAPRTDWVTDHLCPRDDRDYDVNVDRMFYMRKNGMRIDAIRHQIAAWQSAGAVHALEADCLLAPLLYQACYRSNTSGVFKGFHRGWGGQTKTALYRITTDLTLTMPVFFDNRCCNEVTCQDAQGLAHDLRKTELAVAYLDPPYNQHPYGSNYHVLNSIVLWDKPEFSKSITGRTKSAIRLDWRTQRRSAYNHSGRAAAAYRLLMNTLNARFILTSYSTDGTIPLDDLLSANVQRGNVRVQMKGYKRYRVSSQRFSDKPMNVEFIIVTDTHGRSDVSVAQLRNSIESTESVILNQHPESAAGKQQQRSLFEEG
ncbi:MAG: DNA adenine methylase [Bryobacteraceae bacterium]|jgi:adenine-specific DNA-methyltransferase